MKKLLILSSVIVLLFSAFTNSDTSKIPAAALKNAEGKPVNSNTFTNKGKPMIISFWATWCKPCKMELDAINAKYAELQKETGVKLIAVSIDDSRFSARAVAEIKSKGWLYECYLDEDKNLMKAMNIENVPYTVLVDGNDTIVWTHSGYKEGDELELFENVRKLAKGESLAH